MTLYLSCLSCRHCKTAATIPGYSCYHGGHCHSNWIKLHPYSWCQTLKNNTRAYVLNNNTRKFIWATLKQLVPVNSSLSAEHFSNYTLRDGEDTQAWSSDRLKGIKRATWGEFESEIAVGDGEKEENEGDEGHTRTHTQTVTLRIIVRTVKEEQEQNDITHSEMAVRTVPQTEEGSIHITVILLMRWHSVVLVFKPFCCGHLCSQKSCSNIHSSAVLVRVQVWKLAIRSKGTCSLLPWKPALVCYFVRCFLPERSLCERRGGLWGKGGKLHSCDYSFQQSAFLIYVWWSIVGLGIFL